MDGLPIKGLRPGKNKLQTWQISTRLKRVQGFALALFFPFFSGDKGALPEARTHVADIRNVASGTGMPVPYMGLFGMLHDYSDALNSLSSGMLGIINFLLVTAMARRVLLA